jgi:Holliday junction DNA helicase RuvA
MPLFIIAGPRPVISSRRQAIQWICFGLGIASPASPPCNDGKASSHFSGPYEMIGKLRGVLDATGADHVILDVGGVGYEVICSSRTLSRLPPRGSEVSFAIETHVREDAIRLYGFLTEAERGWFRLLQSVQGVGTKVALSILSTLDANALASAIAMQDITLVKRSPGVGPKVALRIVNELRDKAPPLVLAGGAAAGAGDGASQPGQAQTPAIALNPSPVAEAVSALINLGYAPIQANSAISSALAKAGDSARTQDLIRLALKELALMLYAEARSA